MGYATIQRVPHMVRTYEHAKRIYDETKPIRGRDNVRPLGARRDVDTYHMNMRGDDVQFVLYRTPVLTYRPDGVVELFTDGWNSVSTRQFISHVLSVGCYNKNTRMVVEMGGMAQLMPTRGEEVLLLKQVEGKMTILNPQDVVGYKINRAGANNVRARYKEFRNYLKGMLLLRAEPNTGRVNFDIAEFVEVLGTKVNSVNGYRYIDMHDMDNLDLGRRVRVNEVTKASALCARNKFLGWVSSDQGEDKLSNFHRATLILVANIKQLGRIGNIVAGLSGRPTNIEMYPLLKYVDDMLLHLHAQEVLEEYTLKGGVPPNQKYGQWMSTAQRLSSQDGE